MHRKIGCPTYLSKSRFDSKDINCANCASCNIFDILIPTQRSSLTILHMLFFSNAENIRNLRTFLQLGKHFRAGYNRNNQ